MVDTSLPAGEISRLVVVISKSKDIGPVADDFLVVPFPEDLCKENMVLKYCWKLLLHTWWKVRACTAVKTAGINPTDRWYLFLFFRTLRRKKLYRNG